MDHNRYHDLIENLPEIIFEIDSEGRFTYINQAGVELFGYPRDELIGKSALELLGPRGKQAAHQRIVELMSLQSTDAFGEITFFSRDGRRIPSRISATTVVNDGQPVGLRGVIVDITARRELEERLIRNEERLRRITDMAREGIVFFERGIILDANRSFTNLFGFSVEELQGMPIINLALPEYHEIINNHIRSGTDTPCEVRGVRKDGESFDVEFTSQSFTQDGKKIHALMVQDISHRKKIEYMQEHDELTNLVNYRGFINRLRKAIEFAAPRLLRIAVMTIRIDKDRFNVVKNLNANMEKVLLNAIPMEIADRLREIITQEDMAGKTGDSEYMSFHLLPPSQDMETSVNLIHQILAAFSREFIYGVKLVAHVGLTFYPEDVDTNNPIQLINNSRYACEEAINRGIDYLFYDEKSQAETRERVEFIADLIAAVRDDQCRSFMLYYQPKVDAGGNIVGMEALIRWNHPRWNIPGVGFVAPNQFIDVAEEIGLINELGRWVLMEACRQTKAWQQSSEKYRHMEVAVNVSPQQLNEEFIDYIEYVLTTTGLDPECLELEITERETVKDKNVRIIAQIRSRNINVAIDDFGMEYSSLSKLPKLAINTVKLDKSYIDKVACDVDYENLVLHTIRMVHGFNFKVVAEGVEEKAQADKLFSEMECDKIQGYYFCKPLPAESFERLLNMECSLPEIRQPGKTH